MEGFESGKTEGAMKTTKQTKSYTRVPEKEKEIKQIELKIIRKIDYLNY